MGPALSVADALFGKTRQAVLAMLFGNPGRAYYTREIVHAASSGVSQVQRELDQMSRAGLITREPRGNQVYFQANRNAAVFAELVALVAKTFGVADILRKALAASQNRIQVAFIYGSVARGEQHAESDVDILIVGDVLLSDLDEILRAAESRLGRQLSVTVMNRKEFAKRHQAKDHFLRTVLEGPKILLIGDEKQLVKLDERRTR
jgi:predicted nucleotidyltransferase